MSESHAESTPELTGEPVAESIPDPEPGAKPEVGEPEVGECEHVARLESAWEARQEGPRRRGRGWQEPRREAERQARERVVRFSRELGSVKGTAAMLRLSDRTLIQWRTLDRRGHLAATARGRPLERSPVELRNAVISTLKSEGATVGVRPLQALYPGLARGEVSDLVSRYRHLRSKLDSQLLYRLTWIRASTVWAMDHARPPVPIDGEYESILAVRDLANGEQLLWQPVRDETAEETRLYLEVLFAERGVPLVLKSDNGPGFISNLLQSFLKENRVTWLGSPPYTPSYNGSCEAGIGVLKARTAHRAESAGRPGLWVSEDLAGACESTNRLRLAAGHIASADQPATPREREEFLEEVSKIRAEIQKDLMLAPENKRGIMKPETIERQSIKRALVAHGYLKIRRGCISLPLKSFFEAKIS